MPQIIEQGSGSRINRIAGQAADFLRENQARQDKLKQEADRMDLAGQQLELQKNADARAQQRAEQQGAIFEKSFSQQAADTDFYRNLAIENGADPNEVSALSPEAARNAANVLVHQNQLKDRTQSVRRLADDTFAQLGLTQPTDTSAAPGVLVPGQEQQGQPEPFQQLIEAGLQSATTLKDLDQVQSLLFKALDTSHQAELEASQRMQAVETVTPLVQQMSGELPNEIGAKLNTQLKLYQMGHIKMSDLTKSLNDAAKMIDDKNSGNSGKLDFEAKAMDAFDQDLIKQIQDGTMTLEDAKRSSSEARSLNQSSLQPTQAVPPQQETKKSGVATSTKMSRRVIGKLLGKESSLDLIDAMRQIPTGKKRDSFVVNRIAGLAPEKGWSREQVLDIAESILNIAQ